MMKRLLLRFFLLPFIQSKRNIFHFAHFIHQSWKEKKEKKVFFFWGGMCLAKGTHPHQD